MYSLGPRPERLRQVDKGDPSATALLKVDWQVCDRLEYNGQPCRDSLFKRGHLHRSERSDQVSDSVFGARRSLNRYSAGQSQGGKPCDSGETHVDLDCINSDEP